MPPADSENFKIPVVDISNVETQTGADLVDAIAKWGFVFVKGKGLGFTPRVIDATFLLSRKLFDSPVEEKKKCAISPNNKGWSSPYTETLDPKSQKREFKEAFNFGDFIDGKAQQPLPKSLNSDENEISHFASLCQNLCVKLLHLIAIGLKINVNEGGEEWFSRRHDPSRGNSGSILRLLKYPKIPNDTSNDSAADIRAGAHSDYGSLTLLFQRASQVGLEILTPSQTWSNVPVFPKGTENDDFPPILVNIGDLLNYWTNGLLKSTIHRVVMPKDADADRYSIAYFCHPVNDTELVRIPSDLVRARSSESDELPENKKNTRAITAEEHLKSRLAVAYGWPKQHNSAHD